MLPTIITRRGFLSGATAIVAGATTLNAKNNPKSSLLWTPETAYLPKMDGCAVIRMSLYRAGSNDPTLHFACSPRSGLVWNAVPGEEIYLNDGGKLKTIGIFTDVDG